MAPDAFSRASILFAQANDRTFTDSAAGYQSSIVGPPPMNMTQETGETLAGP